MIPRKISRQQARIAGLVVWAGNCTEWRELEHLQRFLCSIEIPVESVLSPNEKRWRWISWHRMHHQQPLSLTALNWDRCSLCEVRHTRNIALDPLAAVVPVCKWIMEPCWTQLLELTWSVHRLVYIGNGLSRVNTITDEGGHGHHQSWLDFVG